MVPVSVALSDNFNSGSYEVVINVSKGCSHLRCPEYWRTCFQAGSLTYQWSGTFCFWPLYPLHGTAWEASKFNSWLASKWVTEERQKRAMPFNTPECLYSSNVSDSGYSGRKLKLHVFKRNVSKTMYRNAKPPASKSISFSFATMHQGPMYYLLLLPFSLSPTPNIYPTPRCVLLFLSFLDKGQSKTK